MSQDSQPRLTYRDAGVDIDAGNELVRRIKPAIRRTNRPGVLGGIGGFGGLFELPIERYKQPVLVSGTDGVGTKLILASQLQDHSTIGIDLVAMCVNDILVCGAEPLYFLDYYATGKLALDKSTTIIEGIAEGCLQAGAALIGGETAEMPDMYQQDDYDLAGFAVGVVEKSKIIDGSKVRPGDRLIGLASSGIHSNGYSLVRKILARSGADAADPMGSTTLARALLAPTRIYAKALLPIMNTHPIHALVHVTGGGLSENIPRVLPADTAVRLQSDSWPTTELYNWLRRGGNLTVDEMRRTFNCGIGMIVITPADAAEAVTADLNRAGESAYHIGEVVSSTQEPGVLWD